MKIFVAGATGVIGVPLVRTLLAKGHEVYGLARSPETVSLLIAAGAIPVRGDALQAQSVCDAVKSVRPEVVVEQLTSLPKDNTREARQAAAAQHNRTRLEGGSNLQAAAIAAGAKRYVAQSSAFLSVPGLGLADETTPLATSISAPGTAATARALATVEDRVTNSQSIEGVVLRYGFFYGPGTWYDEGASTAMQVMNRELPIVGSGEGVWSFVHVDDAASATVAAIEAETLGARLFNITDNDPTEIRKWLPAYARGLGAMPPLILAEEAARLALGEDVFFYGMRLRGASNNLARSLLGFSPRKLEWLVEG